MKPKVGEVWIFGRVYTFLRGRQLIIIDVTDHKVTFQFDGTVTKTGGCAHTATHPIRSFIVNHYRSESLTIQEILNKYI